MEIQIVSPEIQEAAQRAITLYEKINSLSIVNVDDYKFADILFKEVKSRYKYLEDSEESMIKPLRDGYNNSRKKILDFFSPAKEKLGKAKTILNRMMVDWTEEEKKKERKLQIQLEMEAKKRAEEETLRQALEAEALGEKEEAEAILSEPVYVPPIKVVSEVPRSKETQIRETWSAEIFDLPILILGIASGKVSLEAAPGAIYSNADDLKKWAGQFMTSLNGKAQRYKQALSIPGVRAVSKKTQI